MKRKEFALRLATLPRGEGEKVSRKKGGRKREKIPALC